MHGARRRDKKDAPTSVNYSGFHLSSMADAFHRLTSGATAGLGATATNFRASNDPSGASIDGSRVSRDPPPASDLPSESLQSFIQRLREGDRNAVYVLMQASKEASRRKARIHPEEHALIKEYCRNHLTPNVSSSSVAKRSNLQAQSPETPRIISVDDHQNGMSSPCSSPTMDGGPYDSYVAALRSGARRGRHGENNEVVIPSLMDEHRDDFLNACEDCDFHCPDVQRQDLAAIGNHQDGRLIQQQQQQAHNSQCPIPDPNKDSMAYLLLMPTESMYSSVTDEASAMMMQQRLPPPKEKFQYGPRISDASDDMQMIAVVRIKTDETTSGGGTDNNTASINTSIQSLNDNTIPDSTTSSHARDKGVDGVEIHIDDNEIDVELTGCSIKIGYGSVSAPSAETARDEQENQRAPDDGFSTPSEGESTTSNVDSPMVLDDSAEGCTEQSDNTTAGEENEKPQSTDDNPMFFKPIRAEDEDPTSEENSSPLESSSAHSTSESNRNSESATPSYCTTDVPPDRHCSTQVKTSFLTMWSSGSGSSPPSSPCHRPCHRRISMSSRSSLQRPEHLLPFQTESSSKDECRAHQSENDSSGPQPEMGMALPPRQFPEQRSLTQGPRCNEPSVNPRDPEGDISNSKSFQCTEEPEVVEPEGDLHSCDSYYVPGSPGATNKRDSDLGIPPQKQNQADKEPEVGTLNIVESQSREMTFVTNESSSSYGKSYDFSGKSSNSGFANSQFPSHSFSPNQSSPSYLSPRYSSENEVVDDYNSESASQILSQILGSKDDFDTSYSSPGRSYDESTMDKSYLTPSSPSGHCLYLTESGTQGSSTADGQRDALSAARDRDSSGTNAELRMYYIENRTERTNVSDRNVQLFNAADKLFFNTAAAILGETQPNRESPDRGRSGSYSSEEWADSESSGSSLVITGSDSDSSSFMSSQTGASRSPQELNRKLLTPKVLSDAAATPNLTHQYEMPLVQVHVPVPEDGMLPEPESETVDSSNLMQPYAMLSLQVQNDAALAEKEEYPLVSSLIRKVESYDAQIIADRTRRQLLRTASANADHGTKSFSEVENVEPSRDPQPAGKSLITMDSWSTSSSVCSSSASRADKDPRKPSGVQSMTRNTSEEGIFGVKRRYSASCSSESDIIVVEDSEPEDSALLRQTLEIPQIVDNAVDQHKDEFQRPESISASFSPVILEEGQGWGEAVEEHKDEFQTPASVSASLSPFVEQKGQGWGIGVEEYKEELKIPESTAAPFAPVVEQQGKHGSTLSELEREGPSRDDRPTSPINRSVQNKHYQELDKSTLKQVELHISPTEIDIEFASSSQSSDTEPKSREESWGGHVDRFTPQAFGGQEEEKTEIIPPYLDLSCSSREYGRSGQFTSSQESCSGQFETVAVDDECDVEHITLQAMNQGENAGELPRCLQLSSVPGPELCTSAHSLVQPEQQNEPTNEGQSYETDEESLTHQDAVLKRLLSRMRHFVGLRRQSETSLAEPLLPRTSNNLDEEGAPAHTMVQQQNEPTTEEQSNETHEESLTHQDTALNRLLSRLQHFVGLKRQSETALVEPLLPRSSYNLDEEALWQIRYSLEPPVDTQFHDDLLYIIEEGHLTRSNVSHARAPTSCCASVFKKCCRVGGGFWYLFAVVFVASVVLF